VRKVIIIDGTPGTGKTTIAKKLAEQLEGIHIDISELVEREKLYKRIDYERSRAKIADEKQLIKRLVEIIEETNKPLIIEGHYAEIVPKKYVKCAIILRLDPRELEKRLELRKWPKKKIIENVQAELLDSCLIKTIEAYGKDKVREIDTTGKSVLEVISEIIDALENSNKFKPGKINWIEKIRKEGVLERYLTKFSATNT